MDFPVIFEHNGSNMRVARAGIRLLLVFSLITYTVPAFSPSTSLPIVASSRLSPSIGTFDSNALLLGQLFFAPLVQRTLKAHWVSVLGHRDDRTAATETPSWHSMMMLLGLAVAAVLMGSVANAQGLPQVDQHPEVTRMAGRIVLWFFYVLGAIMVYTWIATPILRWKVSFKRDVARLYNRFAPSRFTRIVAKSDGGFQYGFGAASFELSFAMAKELRQKGASRQEALAIVESILRYTPVIEESWSGTTTEGSDNLYGGGYHFPDVTTLEEAAGLVKAAKTIRVPANFSPENTEQVMEIFRQIGWQPKSTCHEYSQLGWGAEGEPPLDPNPGIKHPVPKVEPPSGPSQNTAASLALLPVLAHGIWIHGFHVATAWPYLLMGAAGYLAASYIVSRVDGLRLSSGYRLAPPRSFDMQGLTVNRSTENQLVPVPAVLARSA